MKKMLSLVLALALCLTAVTAFAAAPSKVAGIINVGINGVKVNEVPTFEELAAANAEMLNLVTEGPAAYFGVEVNEVFDFSPVNVTVPAAAVVDGKVEATFVVDTEFEAGEAVTVLLCVNSAWTAYDGIANEDSAVVATVDADVLGAASFCALAK